MVARPALTVLLATILLLGPMVPTVHAAGGGSKTRIDLPGLSEPVQVTTDRNGVRHLSAANDLDLARAQGWVHARDRFFQMDVTRRQVSGDLAELLGSSVLGSDIQSRTIGLRRAAERSASVLTPTERALL